MNSAVVISPYLCYCSDPNGLKEVIPRDVISAQTSEYWKRAIVKLYNEGANKSPEDAKVMCYCSRDQL